MEKIKFGVDYSANEIGNLVDSFYLKEGKKYRIIQLDPTELNLSNRLDIFIKLNAIESIKFNRKNDLSYKLYAQHVVAMTNGKCAEAGNNNKNSINAFYDSFKDTIHSMEEFGFSPEKSLVPVNNSLEPLNGAHRVAAALYFNQKISIVICNDVKVDFGFDFFSNLGFDRYFLFHCVGLMQVYQSDIITGVVWPSTKIDVKYHIENIILTEELKLTDIGIKNFVINTYLHEKWLGTPANNFKGAIGKSSPCSGLNTLKVFIFKKPIESNIIELKESIRNNFGLGKHSIHICDGIHDSLPLTKFSLNPNISNILNSIEKYNYPKYINEIITISKTVKESKLDLVLSGSSLLGLLGLRQPNDIDYISLKCLDIDAIDFHGDNNGVNDFVQIKNNPYSHFTYFDMMFFSVEEFISFKKKRNEVKDVHDIELLENSIASERNIVKKLLKDSELKLKLYKLVIINKLKKLLHRVRLFHLFKKIYVYFKS